jgi:lipoprotein-anchoring transpeptidase ErfK/SrfK
MKFFGKCSLTTAFAALLAMAPGAPAPLSAQDAGGLRLEVIRSERVLHVYRGDERIGSHDVAVGREGHRTPTGEFGIHQVDWNPDWTPPDSEWSADREYKEPGHPDNPMGRVRMIYRAPYSLHGTDALESLGEAASHGSIRVANETIMELARMVMAHGGAERSEEWFEGAIADPEEMREVALPDPVPLVIRD